MRFSRFSLFSVVSGLLLSLFAPSVLAQKYACFESNKGDWCLEMLSAEAPRTVANFLRYVNNGDYASSLIHRSVPGFVIQGGGYDIDSEGLVGTVANYGTIANEFNRSNARGTVSMAKLSGDPNSASNQWFINLADNTFLDAASSGSFTVFAQVASGMDVIDRIAGFRVGDLSFILGSPFNETPLDIPVTATTVDRNDLVIIARAYATDVLPGQAIAPYHCTATVTNDALTELCGTKVTFPANLQGAGAYEVTLELITGAPTPVFAVSSLQPLATLPASYATYNATTQIVTIPSVRTGSRIYDNVQLSLTNLASRQFTLKTFTPRP